MHVALRLDERMIIGSGPLCLSYPLPLWVIQDTIKSVIASLYNLYVLQSACGIADAGTRCIRKTLLLQMLYRKD
jgi:hypothetical protein